MPVTYLTGYNGTTRTKAELLAWSQWQKLDDEYARRALALLDASHVAGQPLGIGEIFRTELQQFTVAKSRHVVVPSTAKHCCTYQGKAYMLLPGMAHAAFPGLSFHEATTPKLEALAIDWTGNLAFLDKHGAEYGIVDAGDWSTREPWHGQPIELPHSRRYYVAATMHPLKAWKLPGTPAAAPIKVLAPLPVLKAGSLANSPVEAKKFQLQCNFWGWQDAMNRNLIVDGDYSAKSAQACMDMQRQFKITADGNYGPQSQAALQKFLDAMAALAPK